MIVAVEGVSASGKTTWCARHRGRVVPEPPALAPPSEEPEAIAEFWTRVHAHRWAQAERIEGREGIAYCDTDPLKLHYTWCLWRLGEVSRPRWDAAVDAHRPAIQSRHVGFADAVVFLEPDAETVRARKEADHGRRRRNFERHLRLLRPLREWYEMLDEDVPGGVLWHGERLTAVELGIASPDRYDLARFDELTKRAARRVG